MFRPSPGSLAPIAAQIHSVARGMAWLCVTLVACAICGAEAQAQLTPELLIGDAVSGDPEKNKNVADAIKRFNNRDVLAARMLLERAKESDPKLPPTDLTMAKMFILSGQNAAGRASLERTVRDHPGDPETYLILADQLYTQGRMIEAEALYDKAIRKIESFSDNEKRKRNFLIRARAGRAAVAAVRRDWPAAIEDLRVWVNAAPDTANAYHRLGRALILNGDAEDGMRSLVKAHELESTLPNPNVTAALLFEQLGERDRARAEFQKAVQADRSDVRTLVAYAQWLLQIDELDQAESALAAARRAEAESLEALVLSGVAAKMAGKRGPAEDHLVDALAVSPSNRSVVNQLALLLIDQIDEGKRKRALEFAKMNAQLNPDNSETNITLAWILYQLRQPNDANAALQKGLQLGNLSADSRYLVAKMLVDQGRNRDAKQLLDEALRSNQGIFVHRSDAQALRDSLD